MGSDINDENDLLSNPNTSHNSNQLENPPKIITGTLAHGFNGNSTRVWSLEDI